MIEPVEAQHFLWVFLSAALIILAGAMYALLFACARLFQRPRLMPLAYACYGVLLSAKRSSFLNSF